MTCSECGSSEGRIVKYKYGNPYCWTHYIQMNRHGRILERTKYTPNEFLVFPDHAEIILYRGEHTPVARALIDLQDLAQVKKHKWHIARRRRRIYAETITGKKQHLLHIFLLGSKPGFEIDHRNGNGLDCRRSNLRYLNHHANVLNVKPPKSGRIGVKWRERKDGPSCWVASILVRGKRTSRHFKTFEEAVAARRALELEHIGTTAEDVLGEC